MKAWYCNLLGAPADGALRGLPTLLALNYEVRMLERDAVNHVLKIRM